MPGLSERIEVRSIIGRFLEHSRIFYFENECRPKVYVGSADWMPRNFFSRIETVFPIEDGLLRDRIINEVLAVTLEDNAKSRLLQADGSYRRCLPAPNEETRWSQKEFMGLADRSEDVPTETSNSGGKDSIAMSVRTNPGS